MNALYALYVGLYIHQLVFLFIDTRSSDFVQLIIHHAITLFIVFASWLVGFTRVGSFTMVLHDCSDVFLELAKCFNYCQKQHPKLSTGADVTFVIFAVSFFYLRLYIYPTRVVASAAFTACQHVTCVPPPYLLADPLQLEHEIEIVRRCWGRTAQVAAWRQQLGVDDLRTTRDNGGRSRARKLSSSDAERALWPLAATPRACGRL